MSQVCIAEALRSSQHIRELDLSNNAFTHVGAQDIAAALGENASVSSVKLRENALGNAGVSAILGAVVSNQASRVECVDCRCAVWSVERAWLPGCRFPVHYI